jgi:hypothetical protein
VFADRIQRVLDDADGSAGDAITLSDVKIAWSTGDGLALQTMRVNPDAIAAWWARKHRQTVQREQGKRRVLRRCDSARPVTAGVDSMS